MYHCWVVGLARTWNRVVECIVFNSILPVVVRLLVRVAYPDKHFYGCYKSKSLRLEYVSLRDAISSRCLCVFSHKLKQKQTCLFPNTRISPSHDQYLISQWMKNNLYWNIYRCGLKEIQLGVERAARRLLARTVSRLNVLLSNPSQIQSVVSTKAKMKLAFSFRFGS